MEICYIYSRDNYGYSNYTDIENNVAYTRLLQNIIAGNTLTYNNRVIEYETEDDYK